MNPILAILIGTLVFREKLTRVQWPAVAAAFAGIAITILVRQDGSRKLTLKLPLKGVLFGIGAGVGQGVGLVLSKIGMDHYASCVPADAPAAFAGAMPFAGTFIRAVAGLAGFWLILRLRREMGQVSSAVKDRKGMLFALLTTFFGPFIGVSLSLMAVQYAKAGIASTLMALTPVLIIAPYALIHHQKISAKEIFGTVVTVTGVALFFLL